MFQIKDYFLKDYGFFSINFVGFGNLRIYQWGCKKLINEIKTKSKIQIYVSITEIKQYVVSSLGLDKI